MLSRSSALWAGSPAYVLVSEINAGFCLQLYRWLPCVPSPLSVDLQTAIPLPSDGWDGASLHSPCSRRQLAAVGRHFQAVLPHWQNHWRWQAAPAANTPLLSPSFLCTLPGASCSVSGGCLKIDPQFSQCKIFLPSEFWDTAVLQLFKAVLKTNYCCYIDIWACAL